MDENKAYRNDDRRIWSESDDKGERYITANPSGGIGICVGGYMVIKTLESWHKIAAGDDRTFKARHKEDEPLAVLAARKGVSVEITPPSFYVKVGEAWEVGVAEPSKGLYTPFDGDTYAAAESKARAYLNNLPDVKAEK